MELFVFWVVMAIICGMVASSKGSSFLAFFFYGLVIWPIALVHAILMSSTVGGAAAARHSQLQGSPRKVAGVISGTPYWRTRSGGYCIEMNGKEVEFPSLAMLEAAISGKSMR